MPIKTSSGKWKWGNVERSSKKELVQTVYGIWKKNGSKGSFSDFLKGTHESALNESFFLDKTNLYFHGSTNKHIRSLEKPSIKKPFCVSQDIEYAVTYAEKEAFGDESDEELNRNNGVVYAVTIDIDNLKIFDFSNDSDIKKLNGRWPNRIVDFFKKDNERNEGFQVDPWMVLADLNDYSRMDDLNAEGKEILRLLNTFVLKRINKKFGTHFKNIGEVNAHRDVSNEKEQYMRSLLLNDLKDLGYDGYKASESRGFESERCYILFNIDCIDKIYLQPIKYSDALKATEYMKKRFKWYENGPTKEFDKKDRAIKEFIKILGQVNHSYY